MPNDSSADDDNDIAEVSQLHAAEEMLDKLERIRRFASRIVCKGITFQVFGVWYYRCAWHG